MRASVCRKLRREVYGDLSTKDRKYAYVRPSPYSFAQILVADPARRAYQKAKREHIEKRQSKGRAGR